MRISIVGFACACALAAPLISQTAKPIPLHKLTTVAQSLEHLGSAPSIRGLPGGRALVHDPAHKRVIVVDSALKTVSVTADSIAGTYPQVYPGQQLIPYLADSTLLPDMQSQGFVVIDPNGKIARAMAHLKGRDLMSGLMQYGGVEGVDAKGRLIYRAVTVPRSLNADRSQTVTRERDTIGIVRADFNLRTVDTVATFTTPHKPTAVVNTDDKGRKTTMMTINPFPPGADDWAVLSDGTIAVVRTHDYHVDFTFPDGKTLSSEKLPFDWRRIPDSEKTARIDSMKRIVDSVSANGKPYGQVALPRIVGPGEPPVIDTITPIVSYVALKDIPDYVPPIRPNGLIPDADGNLWILPSTSSSAKGGLLYDVVNRKGELFERVQLPQDRVVAGFGKNGAVFLGHYDRDAKSWTLERSRIMPA